MPNPISITPMVKKLDHFRSGFCKFWRAWEAETDAATFDEYSAGRHN
jgi:hypothetical protein